MEETKVLNTEVTTQEVEQEEDLTPLFKKVELEETSSEHLVVEPYSYWKSVFRLFFRKPSAIVALVFVALIIILAIVVPLANPGFNPYPTEEFPDLVYAGPSWAHLFGCDRYGVDLWNKTWLGANLSLKLAFTVAAINIVLGILMGVLWGYFRKLDPILIEFRNLIENVPSFLFYMILLYVMDQSFWTLVFVMCIFGWLPLASTIRNQILIINNREYNMASKTLGSGPTKMINHNLLPYLISVIVTVAANMIPAVIASEIALTYFGLGFEPGKDVTLGAVLQSGYGVFVDYPHVFLFPAIIIAILSLSFYYLGLNLADATDPKNHR
ncbi:MAG: ABC transporter permease [Bacilli bacterium]|nr:ABC transporter permease [Bacilli bacterium]